MPRYANARQVEIPEARVYHCCTPVSHAGMAKYCHLVWGPDDPKRSPRPKGGRDDKQPHLTNAKTSRGEWALRIEALMEDGEPRTFNRICVELLDQEASIGFEGPLDEALWGLVEQGRLAHTMEVPVYFIISEADCG